MLAAVEIGEGARHHVAILELRRVGEWLEQVPAHDLDALFGACRAPGGFDAPHHIAQPAMRAPACRRELGPAAKRECAASRGSC